MLLLRILNVRSARRGSFSNLVALFGRKTFGYRDSWKMLDQPGQPLVELDEEEASFAWPG